MKKQILLYLLLVTGLNTYAQDTLKIKKDTTINLTGISVVGVRGDSKTPISSKTLNQKDISKIYHGQEMTYIISLSPSITTQSDGGQELGYTTFRIRGIDQTRINMTLNNCGISEPEDFGVYFSNYPDFAINVQSMQIQRGVGTSSNGVASFGGSINFESQTGIEKYSNVQIGYGSFNTAHVNYVHSTGLDSISRLALFYSLSTSYSDGYKYHSTEQGYSGFISGGYYGKKNIIKFTGFSGRSLSGQSWLASSEQEINNDPRTNENGKGENDNFTQTFGQLQWIKPLTSKSFLSTSIFYNRLNGRWSMFEDETIPVPSQLLQFGLHSNFYGIVSNYHLEDNKFKFDVGIEGNLYNRNHTGALPDTGILYTNTGYKNEFSSYLKINYNILSKLTLFTDLQYRYTDFKYVGDETIPVLHWSFLNPKVGLTYSYNVKINYYFSVGESHREPTRTDLFGGNDNLDLNYFNNIKPEQVIDYELGSNIKLNNLKLQYNLYYMDFHNEITLLGALGSNGLPLMGSTTKSYRSGLEIDVKWQIRKNIDVYNVSNVSRNYFKGDNTSFQPLYTPTINLTTGVEYNLGNLLINLNSRYQDKSYISLDNRYYTPSFLIFNSNINYKINKIILMLTVNNITNKKYFTNGYVIDNQKYYFVNAPLSSYVTVKYNF